ncbi:Uncharacterized protein DAT39_000147, partial [Clarias magur]
PPTRAPGARSSSVRALRKMDWLAGPPEEAKRVAKRLLVDPHQSEMEKPSLSISPCPVPSAACDRDILCLLFLYGH